MRERFKDTGFKPKTLRARTSNCLRINVTGEKAGGGRRSGREYLKKIRDRYAWVGRPHKSRILEEFCLNRGYSFGITVDILRNFS